MCAKSLFRAKNLKKKNPKNASFQTFLGFVVYSPYSFLPMTRIRL